MSEEYKAGQELNRLIETRIFNVPERCSGSPYDMPEERYWECSECGRRFSDDEPALQLSSHRRSLAPPYSTDIGAAWKVAEWLGAGWRFCIVHEWLGLKASPCYTARNRADEFYTESDPSAIWITAETMPLAICRAALATVAAEKEES